MQTDNIIRMGHSLVQHGPANNRVYLLKLDPRDLPDIVDSICDLGHNNGYSKLFAKVPATAYKHFLTRGFIEEALVPAMCKGKCAGIFMSKYLDQARAVPHDSKLIASVLEAARCNSQQSAKGCNPDDVVQLDADHADELAGIYGRVFESYPFPIYDPDFIRKSMKNNVIFFGIRNNGKLVAAASAEMDKSWGCAEMTDFATLAEHQGTGAASTLLARMEKVVHARGIHTAYTIARAESFGMNIVFAKKGYLFSGTLYNNTQICGRLESMNVWHKRIASL